MRVSDLKKLPQWTIVEIAWVDIVEDNVGDPNQSYVVLRRTIGRVWGVKRRNGVDLFTLTFTRDPDGPEQSGWICLPTCVIKELEVIKEVPVADDQDSADKVLPELREGIHVPVRGRAGKRAGEVPMVRLLEPGGNQQETA